MYCFCTWIYILNVMRFWFLNRISWFLNVFLSYKLGIIFLVLCVYCIVLDHSIFCCKFQKLLGLYTLYAWLCVFLRHKFLTTCKWFFIFIFVCDLRDHHYIFLIICLLVCLFSFWFLIKYFNFLGFDFNFKLKY